jgi:hypothetical protein
VVPAGLGPAFAFVAAEPTTSQGCAETVVDESGNLAVAFGPSNGQERFFHLYHPDGTDQGRISAFEIYPEGCGFEGRFNVGPMADAVGSWAPNTSRVQGPLAGGDFVASTFRAFPHGVLTLLQACNAPFSPALAITVQNVDAQGQLVGTISFPSTCSAPLSSAATDLQGNIFLVGKGPVADPSFPSSEVVGRWFDAHGTPLTSWFTVASGIDPGTDVELMTAALSGVLVGLDGEWKLVVESTNTNVFPAPGILGTPFLSRWTLVRGGRAYAAFFNGQFFEQLNLVSAEGDLCGTFSFSGGVVFIGGDGTLVSTSGQNGCTQTVYPQLLR